MPPEPETRAADSLPLVVREGTDAVTVLFDRPERRNALSVDMSRALGEVVDRYATTSLPWSSAAAHRACSWPAPTSPRSRRERSTTASAA
ncbi:hypothetical protein [Blastococcus brunescens]|uniref:Enoyl-CoA hydratase/isomerase family protein n=1 Tax=Blastococcus brunescens TaxID=1564165 RepID=A0ABZ1B582_9ACTN|nr:hypothetical protein [Blastococcus sp. BMG 8361]WRL64180.1 hypothetical protein U6N30_32275 [Blastococcus sp. BMG 8361]